MPRIIDFPRASLQKSLEAARAVDALGGECTKDMCASKLGRKGGGAFEALLGASVKFGLIERKKEKLFTTERFREHKLAYTDEVARGVLRDAFFDVPVFHRISMRFAGQQLPTEILDKLLIREFDVPETNATRVASYFLDGAREVGLLDDQGVVHVGASTPTHEEAEASEDPDQGAREERSQGTVGSFSVRILGPGMNSTIDILEPEDLLIVDAMLEKVKRKLSEESIGIDE